jgi:flavin-dependent dehydrogenase
MVRSEDGTTEIHARHVVGADGLRSVVARRLGLARRFAWPERFAFVAHYASVAEMGDCGEMHVFDDGYCGLADVGAGITNVAVVVTASGARAAAGDAAGFMGRWIAAHQALAARFAGARRVDDVQPTGPFGSRTRQAWARGATLVGDAADFYDPFTGEGIYAALRGGELLAPYIVESLRAADHRRDEPLAAYDRCRRHEFSGKWRLERLVAIAVANPPILSRIARRLRDRRDLADLLVGVTGDFVPAREVLNLRYAWNLLAPDAA